jgi:hypothetical protein
MIINTIKCSVKGCTEDHTEDTFNQGHAGWGSVAGRQNPETQEDTAHLCPKHLDMVFALIELGGK